MRTADARADRAAHARAAEAAVAARILLEVLLVVLLRRVERPRLGELRRDLAAAALGERGLVGVARGECDLALRVGRPVERRAVLRAHVVALAHALRRVVTLPERAQELLEGQHLGVVGDEHGLGMARAARADLGVGRVGRVAARIAHGRRVDARQLPEEALGAPEAAEAELHDLDALGERGQERRAEHGVPGRDGIASSRPGRASDSAMTSRDFERNLSINPPIRMPWVVSHAALSLRHSRHESACRRLACELALARQHPAALQDDARRKVR